VIRWVRNFSTQLAVTQRRVSRKASVFGIGSRVPSAPFEEHEGKPRKASFDQARFREELRNSLSYFAATSNASADSVGTG